MKKNVLFKTIFAFAFAAVLTLFAAACSDDYSPDLEFEDGRLTWKAAPEAVEYIVSVGDAEYRTTETSYVIPAGVYGDVKLTLKVVYADSVSDGWSVKVSITKKLATPTGLKQNGNKLIWDAVENAAYYVVDIGGAEYRANTNEFTLPAGRGGEVKVLAAPSAGGIYSESEYSRTLTISSPLSAPEALRAEDGVIKWNAVQSADYYELTINGEKRNVTDNSYSLKYKLFGEISVSVRALSNDKAYSPSEATEAVLGIEKATLAAPDGLIMAGDTLIFNAVEGATSYEIFVNGQSEAVVYTTLYTLTGSAAFVQVRALSDYAEPSALSKKLVVEIESITTPEELATIAEDGSYRLDADITLNGEWSPKAFKGTFDGNGHSIGNLFVSGDFAAAGLFASLDGATVRDLTVSGSISVASTCHAACAGGLSGEAVSSVIENCIVNVNVAFRSENGIGNVGGVIGKMTDCTVSKVSYSGDVLGENANVGGFVGKACSPENANTVTCSSACGTVTALGGEQSASGGFIGMAVDNTFVASACLADCVTQGTCYVGGFVGYMGSGKIENCLAKGTASATSGVLVHLGGFIGRLEGYNNRISYSISLVAVDSAVAAENACIGGFVGKTVGGNYGGNIYSECIYSRTWSDLDRIGNPSSGRGDGIESKNEDVLKDISTYFSFNALIWKIVDGQLPELYL